MSNLLLREPLSGTLTNGRVDNKLKGVNECYSEVNGILHVSSKADIGNRRAD